MMQSGIAVFLAVLIALASAHADEAKDKQTRAVSKEVYDQITRVHDAIKRLQRQGVSYSDIEPDNLGFSSSSYQECVDLALESSSGEDSEAIALISCFKRHALRSTSE